MSTPELNIHVLDAAYRPFPPFAQWLASVSLDDVRWLRYSTALRNRSDLTPAVLARAREAAKRAAALDTGAIEGLYDVDRGFTYTVAFETAAWELALAQKGEKVKSLFQSQLQAYDYVLDLATKAEPISEAAIRALHEVVCSAQPTYRVETAIGPQEQPLPKGQYKVLPIHVRTRKGTDHSYAPVDMTPPEMARLTNELRSQAFLAAHPVLQAAYAHYSLVVIHPFADGNGRVARALASAFTYRAISMPIVILSEHKNIYLDALESADHGDHQAFVDFMLARSLDTIKLVDETVRSAAVEALEESAAAINRLYVTRGGFSQEQVDQAGMQLLQKLQEAISKLMPQNSQKINLRMDILGQSLATPDPAYRSPIQGGKFLRIMLSTPPPANASVNLNYQLWLPRDAGGDDDILLINRETQDTFVARVDEISPAFSGILQIRLQIFADRIMSTLLKMLKVQAEQAWRNS